MARKHEAGGADGEPGEVDPANPAVLQSPRGHPKVLTRRSQGVLEGLRSHQHASGFLSPRTYNLTISHAHRFVWFRNAKVGTRTLLGFLEQQRADDRLLVLSHTPYPTAAFADYFKFGFVRHPLDRFISAWQDKVHDQNHFRFRPAEWERMKTIENFAAWVADQDLRDLGPTDRHVALQTRLLDLTQIDFVGRMETFSDDLAVVCRETGLSWSEPERRNRSTPRGTTRESASRELRVIVEQAYRLDYQVLGYPLGA